MFLIAFHMWKHLIEKATCPDLASRIIKHKYTHSMAWEPRIQYPQGLLILMVNGIENILEGQQNRERSRRSTTP